MALLFQVSCMDLSREALERMELHGGDGYTYLALVKSWQETGQWSPYVAAHNAPEGLDTHLTAPFPAGVLGLARLLEPSYGPEEAPRIAGKLSGPLLHVATAAVLAWGAAAVLGTGGALLAAAGFLVMPLAPHRFGVLSFDHHALHLFLAALLIAVLLRDTGGQARSGRTACVAGAVAGLGVWSGVEMLIPAGIGGIALGLAWLLRGDPERARGLWLYPIGMAAVLVAGVAVERPPGEWLSLDLDRASAAHGLMAVLLAAGAAGTVRVCGHRALAGTAARSVTAAAMLGSVAVVLWTAAPDFFLGPYGDPDPVVDDLLRGLSTDRSAAELLAATPWMLGYHLWLLGVVGSGVAMGLREEVHRKAWLLIAVGLFVGAVAAFYQYRLVHYYELFASIAFGGAVAAVGRGLWRSRSPVARLASAPMVCVAMASPYLGGVVGVLAYESDETFWSMAWRDADCDWPALGRALAAVPRQGGGGGGNIATYAGPGPELAHFSGRGVVATGCHCNPRGMRDARSVLLSVSEAAREVAERRGVEFLVQCPATSGWQGHDWYVERAGSEGVYGRLVRDEPPDWLVRWSTSAAGEPDVEGFVVWRTTFRN